MKISINDDVLEGLPLPYRPFVAWHKAVHGPLCIVVERVGHGEKRFGCLFLEGTGGPAIWDEWNNMTEREVAANFLPVKHSITLTNQWR